MLGVTAYDGTVQVLCAGWAGWSQPLTGNTLLGPSQMAVFCVFSKYSADLMDESDILLGTSPQKQPP